MRKWIFIGSVILICLVVFAFVWNNKNIPKTESSHLENEIELAAPKSEIPKGSFIYELFFSEFGGRMGNAKCKVIKDNHIRVEKTEDSNLSGPLLIIEGTLLKHKSGRWIISQNPEDINSDEIGGCSDGPTPIDFDTQIIEWC